MVSIAYVRFYYTVFVLIFNNVGGLDLYTKALAIEVFIVLQQQYENFKKQNNM